MKQLIVHMTGRPKGNGYFVLPPYLPQVATITAIDAKVLLWSHTLFPYLCRWMTKELAGSMERLFLEGCSDIPTPFNARTRSISSSALVRRICPACVLDDLAQYGTSYWHRSHLLPAAYICDKHLLPLEATSVALYKPSNDGKNSLPHELIGTPITSQVPAQVLLKISKASLEALLKPAVYRNDWHSEYRRLAAHAGYSSSSAFIASRQLAEDLLNAYGAEFLTLAGCSYNSNQRNAWPTLMVREITDVPFAPVKHILLNTFLTCCDKSEKIKRYRKPGCQQGNRQSLDTRFSRAFVRGLKKIRKQEEAPSLAQFMTTIGCWSQFRHWRAELPNTQKLAAEYVMARKKSSK